MDRENAVAGETILPPKARGARLDDPVLARDLGYGRGRCAGEALRSCLLAITGYPFAGSGLDSAIARRLGVTPQRWGGMKTAGNASAIAPFAHKLGLVLLALGPRDYIVCHPSWLRHAGNWPRPEVVFGRGDTAKAGGSDAG